MSDKSESFDEWHKETIWHGMDFKKASVAERAWNYQQKRIDELERYKKHYDELFSRSIVVDTDEYSALVQKLQAAEEEIKELQEQGVVDVAIREKLLHENKILREAVEKYRKELRLCYSEDHKDFYPKEIDIELDKALEKAGCR